MRARLFLVSVTTGTLSLAAFFSARPAAAGEREPVLGVPGQIVMAELAGVRTGVPSVLTSAGALGLPSPSTSNLGWGGVVGYTEQAYQAGVDSVDGSYSGHVSGSWQQVWVAPAMDVFVTRRLTLGASVGYLHSEARSESTGSLGGYLPGEASTYGAAPRIGYLFPLGHGLSLWPRVGAGISITDNHVHGAGLGLDFAEHTRSFSASLDLALVYHPTQHLLFKVAPQLGGGYSESRGDLEWAGVQDSRSETRSAWFRVGGEATVGVVF